MQGYSHQLAPDGHPVQLIVLRNAQGFEIQFMDWGATWLSCLVPVPVPVPASETTTPLRSDARDGERREVLLRSPNLGAHLNQSAYLGATIGRYANRIGKAAYADPLLAGTKLVQLLANDGDNSLHGGPCGFDSQRWQVESLSLSKVTFRLISADGDQGFPGRVEARACYELTADNAVCVSFEATTDKPCPVNLTNHAYFNLAASHDTVLTHGLQIQADYFVPVSEAGIPQAGLRSVAGTSFDFRVRKPIGQDLLADQEQRRVAGYDHGYLLKTEVATDRVPAATLTAPDNQLQLAITTTKPALQLYTGNHLAGTLGAADQPYAAHAGVALETAFLPDSPNHPSWPCVSSILLPEQRYAHQTRFRFYC